MALDPSNPLAKKYELMRQRVGQEATAQGQQASSALERRQAQLGNLQSGAAIKQQQQVGEQVAMQKQKAVEGVDLAQAGEEAQQAQIKQGQEFATGERLAAQTFGAGEAEKQRGFQQKQIDVENIFKEKAMTMQERQMKAAEDEAAINKASLVYDALKNAMASDDPNAEKLPLAGFYASIGIDPNQAFQPIDRMLQKKKDAEGRRNNIWGGIGAATAGLWM
jgi:hypothetical protein